MDIKELLNLFRVCETTDVRDRVFAFIGLANPGYQISPDYTIESRDLFRFACKRIIVYETRLNILCFCGESYKKTDKRQHGLPSWVPDWSCLSVFLAYNPARDALPFRASADYRSAAAFLPSKGLPDSILRVQCLFVDKIGTQNSHPMSTSDQALDEWRLLAGLQDKDESSRSKIDIPRYRYNDSLTIEDVFMKVIRKGIFTETKTPEYAENIALNSLEHGRFFRSMKGYIGIAELRTHHEDHICVLLGANIPLMLRQVDDHFVPVGQAYVKGLMYGEAIEIMKRGELEVETIDIY